MISYLTILLAVRSMSSPALMAFEFISYARCAVIRLTSSVTICTLDFSRNPDWIEPKPFSPGVPVVGVPLARVSESRFPPSPERPDGFGKRAS